MMAQKRSKPTRIEKWVVVPVRFWVSADDEKALEGALDSIQGHVWLDMASSYGYHIQSELARRERGE